MNFFFDSDFIFALSQFSQKRTVRAKKSKKKKLIFSKKKKSFS